METDGEAWVDFVELRHPALAVRTKGDFIPNDVKLGGEVGRIALLTGELIFGCYLEIWLTDIGYNQDLIWGKLDSYLLRVSF